MPCMIRRITSLAIVLICSIAMAQTKPADESGNWNKVKSASGHTKSKPVFVKFQPGTKAFRVTIKTIADMDERDRPHPSSNVRLALMTETQRDVEDKPVNWRQVDDIYYGKPGETLVETYTFDLDKNGKGKWFQIAISGYLAQYEITIEDQSPGKASKPKASKKKKKSDKTDDDDADQDDESDPGK